MLTGGPSAWYAARLAPNPNASILITGYQDEESPGKKLLDLADHESLGLSHEGVYISVGDALVHEVTAAGQADLPLVEKCSPGSRAGRSFDIHIVQHDVRIVATEFE